MNPKKSISENIKEIIEEILWIIRDYSEDTRRKVESDIRKLIDKGISLSDIPHKILKDYGIDIEKGVERKISELRLSRIPVTVIGKVITINEKEVKTEYGEGKKYYGLLADETGIIPFNSWKLLQNIRKGDVIKIERAVIKEFSGKLQIYISHNSTIEILPPNTILLVHREKEYERYKIIDLKPGMKNVEVIGKVLELQNRKIIVGNTEREVYSGVMADDSGKILCTFWDVEPPINKTILIRGAYVNRFRRLPQLVVDSRCEIRNSEIEIATGGSPIEISKLVERGGVDVTIEGVVVKVKDKSGLIGTCPICKRQVKENYCDIDGPIEAEYELRIWCLIDDGSGVVLAILNNEQSEKIIGMTLEECLETARKALSTAVVSKIVKERIFGIPLNLKGDILTSDKYGLLMIPKEVSLLEKEEIEKRVRALLEEVKE